MNREFIDILQDLGPVTAYAYAVEKGYTGTEEEFEELMASYATVAQQAIAARDDAIDAKDAAVIAKNAAESSATAAAGSATTAAGKATEASVSATAAAGSATTATTKASEASSSATAAAGSATTATTKASEAAASATAAAGSATSASGSETAAEAAQVAAEAAQTAAEETLEEIQETLDTFARVDGTYDGMTVGNAKQLVSTEGVEDTGVYLLRPSGGNLDIANREVNKLIGGTVAWNQLISRYSSDWDSVATGSTTFTTLDDGFSITAKVNSSTVKGAWIHVIADHVYYILADGKVSDPTSTARIGLYTEGGTSLKGISTQSSEFEQLALFIKPASPTNRLYFRMANASVIDTVSTFRNPMCFDLTQMFGSTIADYIYSLEQAEAGAGAAWFRKLFPKPYYEYNAGELMSVNASAHITTGFNQWDEEWELGTIGLTSGTKIAATDKIRTKNYVPVMPNTAYYFKFPSNWRMCWYDATKTIIGAGSTRNPNVTLTSPDGARFMMFALDGATTYNHDICINLSNPARNGEYEPYESHRYALDHTVQLRGLPKLDDENQLYYDGDTYEADGTVTRKYAVGTFTGAASENWEGYSSAGTGTTGAQINIGDNVGNRKAIVNNLGITPQITPSGSTIYGITQLNGKLMVTFPTTMFADVAAWKTYLQSHNLTVVRELATPTTEQADIFAENQVVDTYGTEAYEDYAESQGDRDVAIPVGHHTLYQVNLKDKLQHLPNLAQADGAYYVQQTGKQMRLRSFDPYSLNAFPTDKVDGPVASFPDGADDIPLKSLIVDINPVQDLHGYDSPWPAGGGKNILPNAYTTATISGVTFTVHDDGTVRVNGTATEDASFMLMTAENINHLLENGETYFFSGCPAGGSTSTYMTRLNVVGKYDIGSGFTQTFTGITIGNFTIKIASGYTANNLLFKPQIVKSSVAVAWTPYSNICPISGWSSLHVYDDPLYAGVIEWNQQVQNGNFESTSGWTDIASVSDNVATTTSLVRYATARQTLPLIVGHKYFVTITATADSSRELAVGFWATGTAHSVKRFNVIQGVFATAEAILTALSGDNRIAVSNWESGAAVLQLKNCMVIDITQMFGAGNEPATVEEFKALFPHDYYPHNTGTETLVGTVNGMDTRSISISLGSTVYSGTLDVLTGVVTVDKTKMTFSRDVTIGLNEQDANTTRIGMLLPNARRVSFAERNQFICDMGAYSARATGANAQIGDCTLYTVTSGVYFLLHAPKFPTYDEAFAYLIENECSVVYALATPLTIQLTPQEINSFLGTNNIWADTGDTHAIYRADIGLYIQKLTGSTEEDMTANVNIASGKYFLVGNTLYLSTSAIAAGEQIVPGTNCTLTNLAEALNALNT